MILTLALAAERLGLTGSNATRMALHRLRALEAASGRTLVVPVGKGTGRRARYMVLENEFEAALEGNFRRHVDATADVIRRHMERIDERITALSERLTNVEQRCTSESITTPRV